MARTLATSTTSSDRNAKVTAFASFRVVGDALTPDQVTRVLKVVPSLAYSKGDHYYGGPRSPKLVGRTGVWYLSTKGIVASDKLGDHLEFIARLLQNGSAAGAPLKALRQLLRRHDLRADVSCFWSGPAGARRPSIPRSIQALMKELPANIETDFDDDAEPGRHAA